MDPLKLREMDQEADRTIANWSFAGLVANLAPPPFDLVAVAAVFARMGLRLGNIYGVETDWATVRTIGTSIVTGMGAVLGAAYVATGLLKWIPGVSLWAALLVQPPMVGAIAYAAGHAFKEYFRAQLEGRVLTSDQIGDLAGVALREKLKGIVPGRGDTKDEAPEDGYDVAVGMLPGQDTPDTNTQAPETDADLLRILELPYQDRQLVSVVTAPEITETAKVRRSGRRLHGLRALTLTEEEATQLAFPAEHPRSNMLYIGHPAVPAIYYPAAQFHRSTFEHKFWEAVRILVSLGATHLAAIYATGWGSEVSATLKVPASMTELQADVNPKIRSGSGTQVLLQVLFEADLPGNRSLCLPDDLAWYPKEKSWQRIVNARLQGALHDFELTVSYQDSFGVDGSLVVPAREASLDAGGSSLEYRPTVWQIVGTFE